MTSDQLQAEALGSTRVPHGGLNWPPSGRVTEFNFSRFGDSGSTRIRVYYDAQRQPVRVEINKQSYIRF